MNIRCIIVDDEPLARDGMELLVAEAGFLQLVATCRSAMEANAILAKEQIDLIFLDIQMPKIRGIDFLKTLTVKPLVIITTAYSDFALEGFELNVLDYLVKPITPERFLVSVNRARELMSIKQTATQDGAPDYFFIRANNGYEKILYQEILFIEATQNYSTIHTTRAKFMTLTTLRTLEEQLPVGKFLRIQKSYIVAIDKIQSFTGNEVTLQQYSLPVSKNYKEKLMTLIDQRLIKK
ncbi:DNA-binding response regulator [Niastella yeongjuensis]|uniref:DNA-binding response regulator n=1 Tax=Niastella yeongjuensis TaxID=354355 RepID=A0A1V9EGE9_9BACT|nr:LytTR family DNA-binding domain-containing protein [Niastella yeongjuensis]OQP44995.1 DNA-binding response regulator [Niastella yeongjuensis]SEP49145.1 two component transcriptional regulator, LytTR family [Niastella yeongjuensis]